jgi:hypothetical protein
MWTGVEFNTNSAEVKKAFSKYNFIMKHLAFKRDKSRVSADEFVAAIQRASNVNAAMMLRQEELIRLEKRRTVSYPRNASNIVVYLVSPVDNACQHDAPASPSACTSPEPRPGVLSTSNVTLDSPVRDVSSPLCSELSFVSESDTDVSSYEETESDSDLDV